LGQGNVPLKKSFELLSAHNYEGALSIEWEYAWHPELDPPEIALPAALAAIRSLLTAVQMESA
jgi:sugar phosphate isomerase/epimerase